MAYRLFLDLIATIDSPADSGKKLWRILGINICHGIMVSATEQWASRNIQQIVRTDFEMYNTPAGGE